MSKKKFTFTRILLLILLVIAIAVVSHLVTNWRYITMGSNIERSNGRMEAESYDVSAMYPGRLEKLYVKEGDLVKKDEPMALISSTDQKNQLLIAENQATGLQSKLRQIEAKAEAARSKLELSKLQYTNAVSLSKQNLISPTELKMKKIQLDADKALLAEAQAGVDEVRNGIKEADLQITRLKDVIGEFELLSPANGKVEQSILDEGSIVPQGGRVFTVTREDEYHINVFYPTNVASQLKVGDEARVMVDGIDKVFPATVDFVDNKTQFTPKFVETKNERAKFMFKVKVKIDPKVVAAYEGILKSGIPADAYVNVDPSKGFPSFLNDNLATPNDNGGAKRVAANDSNSAPRPSDDAADEPAKADDSTSQDGGAAKAQ